MQTHKELVFAKLTLRTGIFLKLFGGVKTAVVSLLMNKDEMSVCSFNLVTLGSPTLESALCATGGYSFKQQKKPVFKTLLESDKSVYFSSPFITAVEHPHALGMGLEGWSSSAAVALILHYGQILRRYLYCGVTYSIFLLVSQLVGDEPLF